MSFGSSSVGSGSRGARSFEFGRTHVVRPKGKHQATIVWLHGLGDNGLRFKYEAKDVYALEGNYCVRKLFSIPQFFNLVAYTNSSSQLLETLPLPNVKWICPTAPVRPVAIFGGFPCTAWFDVGDLSEEGPSDAEGLDSSAAHVANLLSTEPADIKLGVGGFSMGAATALYSATCCTHGKYGNGNPYPVNLSAAVGLSGWLPCAKVLPDKLGESEESARRASTFPLLLLHGKGDDVVRYKFGEKSAEVLTSSGFQNTTFKSYNGLGHYTVPEEMDDLCKWITSTLELETLRP